MYKDQACSYPSSLVNAKTTRFQTHFAIDFETNDTRLRNPLTKVPALRLRCGPDYQVSSSAEVNYRRSVPQRRTRVAHTPTACSVCTKCFAKSGDRPVALVVSSQELRQASAAAGMYVVKATAAY